MIQRMKLCTNKISLLVQQCLRRPYFLLFFFSLSPLRIRTNWLIPFIMGCLVASDVWLKLALLDLKEKKMWKIYTRQIKDKTWSEMFTCNLSSCEFKVNSEIIFFPNTYRLKSTMYLLFIKSVLIIWTLGKSINSTYSPCEQFLPCKSHSASVHGSLVSTGFLLVVPV